MQYNYLLLGLLKQEECNTDYSHESQTKPHLKKAHIFAAYSNMFLLTGNYNSFIAPHYPMRDSKIFIGVNWRLFN